MGNGKKKKGGRIRRRTKNGKWLQASKGRVLIITAFIRHPFPLQWDHTFKLSLILIFGSHQLKFNLLWALVLLTSARISSIYLT